MGVRIGSQVTFYLEERRVSGTVVARGAVGLVRVRFEHEGAEHELELRENLLNRKWREPSARRKRH